ncbi:DUF2158 domain-containing protein [Burkholderia cenocepacia]|uniref:DUF2158 domain-containing protein n=1 Tax=Burkholderia cenocepacia TaxID=95486 RepID=UPI000761D744|nr:DUF2158 domain-containing protein [Burkholderia cenocepacia]KWU23347.1 hypothetical protein AS149_37380 [Burkholderia cenocepacia]
MSKPYAVGAVVELLSGGPLATVVRDKNLEAGSKFVEIAWFDGSSLKKEILPKDALREKTPAPSSKPAAPADGE